MSGMHPPSPSPLSDQVRCPEPLRGARRGPAGQGQALCLLLPWALRHRQRSIYLVNYEHVCLRSPSVILVWMVMIQGGHVKTMSLINGNPLNETPCY